MCNNSNLSFIFTILQNLIKVIKYIVPIILIVMATLDVAKIIMNTDYKVKKESTSNIVKRIIYALLFFLVPTLVSLLFKILIANNNPNDYGGGSTYNSNWAACVSEILG
jgi:propanediol dehydratase large subunit